MLPVMNSRADDPLGRVGHVVAVGPNESVYINGIDHIRNRVFIDHVLKQIKYEEGVINLDINQRCQKFEVTALFIVHAVWMILAAYFFCGFSFILLAVPLLVSSFLLPVVIPVFLLKKLYRKLLVVQGGRRLASIKRDVFKKHGINDLLDS